MLLSGDLIHAEEMRKFNSEVEKQEIDERHKEMRREYERARLNLIAKQAQEVEQRKAEQSIETGILGENERKDLQTKMRRIEAVEKTLEEEKDYGKFCARKYKRDCKIVLPPTVLTSVKEFGVVGSRKGSPIGSPEWRELRERSVATPLPLSSLRVKHYKGRKLVRGRRRADR
jgi:hypothetical protein